MNLEPITKDTVIEDEKIILKYRDTVLFSSSNMSIINGAKGSMKSSCRDYLVENLLSPGDQFQSNLTGDVLVIDTEMSVRLIKNNLKRFSNTEKLHFYSTKGLPQEEVRSTVEKLIERHSPEVLILDSSRDFAINSNDPGESMKIINQLLYWTMAYKVHILNIVHSVRTEGGFKTKGTFGSELENKAETILSMQKWKTDSKVICTFSRETLPFDDFKITIDRDGKPRQV